MPLLIVIFLSLAVLAENSSPPVRSLRIGSTFSVTGKGIGRISSIEGEANDQTFTTAIRFEFENAPSETLRQKKTILENSTLQEITYEEFLILNRGKLAPIEVEFEPIHRDFGIFDLSYKALLHRLTLNILRPITLTLKRSLLTYPMGLCYLYERAPSRVTERTLPVQSIVFQSIDIHYLKSSESNTQPVLTLYQDESTNVGLRCQPESGWNIPQTIEGLIDQSQTDGVEWSLSQKNSES
jgi:hypothetical protein